MTLAQLLEWASDKSRFVHINDYAAFCKEYLNFIFDGLQAVIVSKNENNYKFFQYKRDGSYNITRPLNSELMYSIDDFNKANENFIYSLAHIREIQNNCEMRTVINRFIYSCQQAIGAALDALPAGNCRYRNISSRRNNFSACYC